MTLSFDRAQQRHDANTEPPEPRSCAPDEHTHDWSTLRVSDEDAGNGVVLVDCESCNAVAWASVQQERVSWEWEL